MKSDANRTRPDPGARAGSTDRGSRAASDAVRVARPFHAWLHYDVLRHVEGTSAESMHDGRRPWRPWVEPLTRAMHQEDHDQVQLLPLVVEDYSAMHQAAGDGALGRALRDAWTLEFHRVSHAWQADEGYGARLERFWQHAAEPLARCRGALWQDDPCGLTLLDVPALGRHVRSRRVDDQRVLALDLARGPGELVARVIYEEARAGAAGGNMQRYAPHESGRMDRAGDPLQMSPDAMAARRAEQIIETEAPQLLVDFRRWRGQAHHAPSAACD